MQIRPGLSGLPTCPVRLRPCGEALMSLAPGPNGEPVRGSVMALRSREILSFLDLDQDMPPRQLLIPNSFNNDRCP